MSVITLNNGTQVRVSEEDGERFSGFSWSQFRNGRAYRKELIPREERSDGKSHRTLLLHREIMGVSDDRQVVFRDGDPTNCTRENLVVVGPEFRSRQRVKKAGSSRFRGVGWNRAKEMWQAYLRVNGKLRHLGFFPAGEEGEEQAARAYDEAARAEIGELAVLNFPAPAQAHRPRRRRLVAHPAALLQARARPRLTATPTAAPAAAPARIEVPAIVSEAPAPAAEAPAAVVAEAPAAAPPVEELFNKPVQELTPEELELMKARFLGERYRARPRRMGRVG